MAQWNLGHAFSYTSRQGRALFPGSQCTSRGLVLGSSVLICKTGAVNITSGSLGLIQYSLNR